MGSIIEKSFGVAGKKVTIIYDLAFYSEKEYLRDFSDFRNYQTKKEKFSEKDGTDWKFLNAKEIKYIQFPDFLKIATEIFSKVIYQALRENPTIMVSDQNEFKVRIILWRVPGREWYMEEYPKKEMKGERYAEYLQMLESEEVEHADYLTAGVFLIQNVAAPWFYKKKIDYAYIYRFLAHELEHHKHFMVDFYKYEDEISRKLKIKVRKAPNYRINYVFLTAHQLLNEGIADFVTIANRPRIDIHMGWIYKFRSDFDKLATMTGKNKVHEFWVDNLAYGTYQGGAYYCGKIMCFTIELAIAKRMKRQPFIYLGKNEQYPLEAIDKIMSKNEVFNVGNPDYDIFKKTYAEITKYKYDYRKFIALYEWACKELGIRKRNMIIWYGFFDDVKKKATKFYEQYSMKQKAEMYRKVKSIVRKEYKFE